MQFTQIAALLIAVTGVVATPAAKAMDMEPFHLYARSCGAGLLKGKALAVCEQACKVACVSPYCLTDHDFFYENHLTWPFATTRKLSLSPLPPRPAPPPATGSGPSGRSPSPRSREPMPLPLSSRPATNHSRRGPRLSLRSRPRLTPATRRPPRSLPRRPGLTPALLLPSPLARSAVAPVLSHATRRSWRWCRRSASLSA